MKYIVYPAVLEFNEKDNVCVISVHDLDLTTIGLTVEKTFLDACQNFQDYVSFAIKYDMSMVEPTSYVDFEKLNPKKKIILLRAVVDGEKFRSVGLEQAYKDVIKSMIE